MMHPDDPNNPLGGKNITEEELIELQIDKWEDIYQSNKEDNCGDK